MLKKDDHEEKEDSRDTPGKNETDENVEASEGDTDTEEHPVYEESAKVKETQKLYQICLINSGVSQKEWAQKWSKMILESISS